MPSLSNLSLSLDDEEFVWGLFVDYHFLSGAQQGFRLFRPKAELGRLSSIAMIAEYFLQFQLLAMRFFHAYS